MTAVDLTGFFIPSVVRKILLAVTANGAAMINEPRQSPMLSCWIAAPVKAESTSGLSSFS
jgi:hypothetical protein